MVPLGTTGVIRKGPWGVGWQVRVEEESNGYLILFSCDFNNRMAEGYDQWAANEEAVNARLQNFEIEWGAI